MAHDDAGRVAREANEYAEFYGLTWRLLVPRWSDQFRDEMRAKARAADAKKAADTKKRREKQMLALAEKVTEWRAGAAVSLWDSPDTLLRVKGNRIETSRGAEIPLRCAPAIWQLIQHARAGVACLSGPQIGNFKIDTITLDGTLRAGCHTIQYSELERMARTLGYIKGEQ
jgi:hypothetical protein